MKYKFVLLFFFSFSTLFAEERAWIEKFNFCDFPKAAASFVSRTIIFDRLGYRKKQFYKDLLLK